MILRVRLICSESMALIHIPERPLILICRLPSSLVAQGWPGVRYRRPGRNTAMANSDARGGRLHCLVAVLQDRLLVVGRPCNGGGLRNGHGWLALWCVLCLGHGSCPYQAYKTFGLYTDYAMDLIIFDTPPCPTTSIPVTRSLNIARTRIRKTKSECAHRGS